MKVNQRSMIYAGLCYWELDAVRWRLIRSTTASNLGPFGAGGVVVDLRTLTVVLELTCEIDAGEPVQDFSDATCWFGEHRLNRKAVGDPTCLVIQPGSTVCDQPEAKENGGHCACVHGQAQGNRQSLRSYSKSILECETERAQSLHTHFMKETRTETTVWRAMSVDPTTGPWRALVSKHLVRPMDHKLHSWGQVAMCCREQRQAQYLCYLRVPSAGP